MRALALGLAVLAVTGCAPNRDWAPRGLRYVLDDPNVSAAEKVQMIRFYDAFYHGGSGGDSVLCVGGAVPGLLWATCR